MKQVLIVVDLQNEYLPTGKLPLFNIETATANAARAIAFARTHNIPVVHIRHESKTSDAPIFVPGTAAVEIQKDVAPQAEESVVVKNFVNSFRDTPLKHILETQGAQELIVVGAMSHMCIDAVVRAASDMGYVVTVLHDACTTLDLEFNGVHVSAPHVHAAMMASFAFAYATVKSTQEYIDTIAQ